MFILALLYEKKIPQQRWEGWKRKKKILFLKLRVQNRVEWKINPFFTSQYNSVCTNIFRPLSIMKTSIFSKRCWYIWLNPNPEKMRILNQKIQTPEFWFSHFGLTAARSWIEIWKELCYLDYLSIIFLVICFQNPLHNFLIQAINFLSWFAKAFLILIVSHHIQFLIRWIIFIFVIDVKEKKIMYKKSLPKTKNMNFKLNKTYAFKIIMKPLSSHKYSAQNYLCEVAKFSNFTA